MGCGLGGAQWCALVGVCGKVFRVASSLFRKISVSIGSRLREAREALGLTQHVLAAELKATERTVNNWERDVSSPTAVALAGMAALGLDVRFVVTGKRDYTPPVALTAEEQTLLAYWREASKDTRVAAMGALLGASVVRSAVQQKFAAPVGQVIEGDAHITSARFVAHDHTKPYGPASKARPAKPPKKP